MMIMQSMMICLGGLAGGAVAGIIIGVLSCSGIVVVVVVVIMVSLKKRKGQQTVAPAGGNTLHSPLFVGVAPLVQFLCRTVALIVSPHQLVVKVFVILLVWWWY